MSNQNTRKLLRDKARKYRLENERVTLESFEFKHLTTLLSDAADVLEAYSDQEDFALEIRATLKKIKSGGTT